MPNLHLKVIPNELLIARRRLEELTNVKILEDLYWDSIVSKWILHCSINLELTSNKKIPKETHWFVVIDNNYPLGSIKFYPSKENSITQTFYHQMYNGDLNQNLRWRTGNLCLDSNLKIFSKLGLDIEPIDYEEKLLWHFERALLWLFHAEQNTLISSEDPFELPDFNVCLDTVAFIENESSFTKWKSASQNYGLVDFTHLDNHFPKTLLLLNFKYINGEQLYELDWNSYIKEKNLTTSKSSAGWILFDNVPFIEPWQAPMNWGDLKNCCESQNINLMSILKKICRHLRAESIPIILIGFPVKEKFNSKNKSIYWQPLVISKLNKFNRKVNGFRNIESYNWFKDTITSFKDNQPIQWMNTENWDENELLSRGSANNKFSNSSMLLLGAGSVGSILSELIVRNGAKELTIMDSDKFFAGNIVRHTLKLNNINSFKAESLKKRLLNISPYIEVKSINKNFPLQDNSIHPSDYDIIFDCTGEDAVLNQLANTPSNTLKHFFSISLGYGAKRLFLFYCQNHSFEYKIFKRLINPWLQKEQSETENISFPREGLGCWHPIFPARSDDIWLMISTAFKVIESRISNTNRVTTLFVFEQVWENENFNGVSLIHQEEYNEQCFSET